MELWEWRDLSPRDLIAEIGNLHVDQFDALPFGAIELDPTGRVLRYNATEASLARRDPADVVGRHFFDEIAPCTNVREFRGRFEEAAWRRDLDVTFDYTFRFPHGWRQVRIRMVSISGISRILLTVEPTRMIARPEPTRTRRETECA